MAFYDWQSNKSVIECNKQMFQNELLCDVSFRVGMEKQIIKAHKYVLASRSCVFYAMFADGMREGQGEVIDIPDIEPAIFRTVMQFLYYEEIKIDLNNVLALMYASQKYTIQDLIRKCMNRLKSKMDPENICVIIEAAHTYDNEQLREDSLRMALRHPLQVFQSEVFTDLCSDCLELILRQDKLSLKEEDIFQATISYAEKKCKDRGVIVSPENQRLILGKAFNQIRFPIMDPTFFSNKVEPMGILTSSECVKVMKFFMNKNSGCEIFNTKPRNLQKSLFRFHEVASGWSYKRNKQDSIIFSPSANILLHGVVIYGSCDVSTEYKINMALKQVPFYAVVANKPSIHIETDGAQKLYNIYFDRPVEVKKDKEYSLSVTFKEPAVASYKGINGVPEMEQEGVKFKFKNCSKSTNNTSVDTGQIPAILYEVIP